MKEKKYVKPKVVRVRLDVTQATLGTSCWSTVNRVDTDTCTSAYPNCST